MDKYLEIPVLTSIDEEVGIVLDIEEMQRILDEKLEQLEEDITETNHVRNEHLTSKHTAGEEPVQEGEQ
tara:strand:+ start:1393 stop:1599 length:207 start_codon:yes stop_codon:yes gene_type:complete